MKTLLLFPPAASPTYVPLGLASLAAYLRSQVSSPDLTVLDLNIAHWRSQALLVPQGPALLNFLQQRSCFYDPQQYRQHQSTWALVNQACSELQRAAEAYLETGTWCERLEQELGPTVQQIRDTGIELLGLSIMYLDQMACGLALTRRVHELMQPHRPLCVLGGAALCAVQVNELLQGADFIDAVLPGEGENAFVQLYQGVPIEQIPGLLRRTQPHPKTSPEPASLSLVTLPVPDFTDLALADYANPEPVLPVVLSRHCAWARCRFCAHNHSFADHRSKTIEQFVDELQTLSLRHHCRHFYLADQYLPTAALVELSHALMQRNLDIKFHCMARLTADLTPDVLELAVRAGCCWISWGVETGSQRLLNLVRKGIRREHIERILQDSHHVGITNLLMMIFGLPTSRPEDLDQTLDLLGEVYPYADAITASSFVLFQGTPFAQNPERFQLAVTGLEPLLTLNGHPLHTTRHHHQDITTDGRHTAPIGPMEISQWHQRRRWYGPIPFTESLPCEHLLLYSAERQAQGHNRPVTPPAPKRVA